uniref:Protein xylosyltransferase n=2 Tax=Lotharella oceanica TaxID=641309 RepID=A0A7S2TG47_9EUKA|mmetsp:Transcript_10006/g.19203  ORF Transcript_10006/g.19203 Transcript_10006/m.19203 type:complete len:374 (+) Transcript_10006:266-1387(+)|eukprot:CAMPEP_0170174546 /NCGR_PEP_ID=MMETSP0040_2-20121228/7773_1 /TAXON_ID=641309 /ORGANISM="Lotharella oceanica, Strain CCMP622" /LENGTH=373 /DNA_ID=CAMNT_0010416239 /DNA_START=228 /DNA_END=1349 /DNA_ORIENTATION=+
MADPVVEGSFQHPNLRNHLEPETGLFHVVLHQMNDLAADLHELELEVTDAVLLEQDGQLKEDESNFEFLSQEEVERQCLVRRHGLIEKITPSGKLAYIFLLTDRLSFAKMWNSVFKAAEPGTWSAVMHLSAGNMAADAPPVSFEYHAARPTGSSWCNVTFVMVEALRTAVEDPDVAGVVFVSNSHIPLKHPNRLREILLGEDRSIFRSAEGCTDESCKAEMWSYMRRVDVEHLIHDWNHGGRDLVNKLVIYDTSSTPHPLHVEGCGDEKYPLWAVHKWQGQNPKLEYSLRPVFTLWNKMVTSALGEEEYLKPYIKGHPAVLQNVSARTYFRMRQSCSLFARKVLPNSTFQGQMPLVDYIEMEMLNRNVPSPLG